jgi:hypothetical protein
MRYIQIQDTGSGELEDSRVVQDSTERRLLNVPSAVTL